MHIPRKNGGKGLIAIEDCVQPAVRGLEVSVDVNVEKLIQTTRGDRVRSRESFE